ncbi:MAG: hypothetical protein ABI550_05720 [Ignavibacteriaceae bacterium]
MAKSREILKQKAKKSSKLNESIESVESTNEAADLSPKTIINKEGKEVLVFKDPLYSREKRSIINYSVFNGKWEFENIDDMDENDPEKCAVKFTPIKDGSNLTITFKSIKDRVEFMDSIYSDNDLKQIGGGMSLENLANSKVLKTTGGLIGLSMVGYGLYKLLKGKDE